MKRGSLIRLKQYQQSNVRDKKILILMDVEVLTELGEHDRIGAPVALEPAAGNGKADEAQPESISGGNFYGNRPPQTAQTANRASTNGAAHANLHPIEAISPYAHKWTIRARCTFKSDIKTWHNRNGEGKLFSVNLLDESGEIRATGFNDQCDNLYDVFQEGNVYYISAPCRVQLAKKQFSNVNNDYELTFERETHVEKTEAQDDVPKMRYNFTSIGDLQNIEKDTTIDTIGVLREVGELGEIISKTTSKPYNKRDLTLVDNTGFSVRLTIWGNSATSFNAAPDSVVAFKGVKVSDFNGRSLSLLSSGSMTVDPDIEEAHKLKGWYDAAGRDDKFQSHQNADGAGSGSTRSNNTITISQAKDLELLLVPDQKPEWFSIKASIMFVSHKTFAYPACASEGCNKKVVMIDDDQWRCENCEKVHPKPEYRYILSLFAYDHTGQIRLTAFDKVAQIIMGMTANELMEMEYDEEAKKAAFANATCRTWIFRCSAKIDTFGEETR
jgi:replication factor A1